MEDNFTIVPMRKGCRNLHKLPPGNLIIHGVKQKEGQNILYTHLPALCGSKPKETRVGWMRVTKDISCDICRREADRIYLQLKAIREDKNNAKDGSEKESR